jgi:alkylhydroperoxidase family enzyme
MAVRYGEAVEDGVTEELVCELVEPEQAPNLTEAERAALRFADLLATDHHRIDDGTIDDLRQHFTEEEVVELGHAHRRLRRLRPAVEAWDMVDESRPVQSSRGRAGDPWGTGATVIGRSRG